MVTTGSWAFTAMWVRSRSAALGRRSLVAEATAQAAVCEGQLGRTDAAQSAVSQVLALLADGVVGIARHETLGARRACHQAMEAVGDVRAAPLLEELHADVQARAAELTEVSDRERLIQALPVLRDIVAAHRRMHGQSKAEG